MTVTTQDEAREQERAELREAITNMAATAARMPAHWVDRKAALHVRINELLSDLEAL